MALAYYHDPARPAASRTGGINFDAKLRRQSIEPDDLLIGHVGGDGHVRPRVPCGRADDRGRRARGAAARALRGVGVRRGQGDARRRILARGHRGPRSRSRGRIPSRAPASRSCSRTSSTATSDEEEERMKTIKGPGIFLAQFAGDTAPFNSLRQRSRGWAASLGYKGIQIPTWDARLFDLDKAARSKTYCDEIARHLPRSGRRDHRALDASAGPARGRASRPTTPASTASRRRRCAATRRRGQAGRSSRC